MSISSLEVALRRIELSTPESPIAVFKTKIIDRVDAVFAGTVKTQEAIRYGHRDYIGTFDGSMDIKHVANQIKPHVKQLDLEVA
jgi:hypothetical protein